MWAKLHKFNVMSHLLRNVAGGVSAGKTRETELEFFYEKHAEDPTMSFTEMLQLYRRAGRHTRMASTSLRAVFMPTLDMIIVTRPESQGSYHSKFA